jgi:hypothetical protein
LKFQTFGIEETNWADKVFGHLGYFGIFGQFISTHFGTVSPLSKGSVIQVYIDIPNIHLRLGFEFGLQSIMNLAIVCP